MDTRTALLLTFTAFTAAPAGAVMVAGQDASYVLGQANYSSRNAATTQNGMSGPAGLAYDPYDKRLFVADMLNSRVLIYDLSNGITDFMNASWVLGQPNFTSNSPATTQSGMYLPTSVAYNPKYKLLYVTDAFNYRVLVYFIGNGITNGMNANFVLGQSTWTTRVQTGGDKGFYLPVSVSVDPKLDRVFVADQQLHRIMVYYMGWGISDNMAATWLLGQTTFGSTTTATTAINLNYPSGVTYEPIVESVFIADSGNNRIVGHRLFGDPLYTSRPANILLGQPDFTSNSAGTTSNTLNQPVGVALDPTAYIFFASDKNNNRTLMYGLYSGNDAFGSPTMKAVLGQQDYVSSSSATARNRLAKPNGLAYDSTASHRLFLSDAGNNRVLVFSANPPTGSLTIAGRVTAANDPYPTVAGVPIELRDSLGRIIATKKTDSDGLYSFSSTDGLVENGKYNVMPAVSQMQSAAPAQIGIPSLPGAGATANFQIRGWPATINVYGLTNHSFVMVSTFGYTGGGSANPPPLSASIRNLYFAGAGPDGVATLKVPELPPTVDTMIWPPPPPPGYYLTCWQAQTSGGSLTFTRMPTSGSFGPIVIAPGEVRTIQCQ